LEKLSFLNALNNKHKKMFAQIHPIIIVSCTSKQRYRTDTDMSMNTMTTPASTTITTFAVGYAGRSH
jgi:hypothetical protein